MAGLRIRKVADKSEGMRIPGYDPFSNERVLINPETHTAESWPLKGIQFEGDIPDQTNVPTSFVQMGRNEGWLSVEGESVVHRPGGPPDDQWRITHTFVHCEVIVFHTLLGDIRYRVVHQPDKYVDSDDPLDVVTDAIYEDGGTRVDWFYGLEREG